jgi:tetratricopeptide (TPR) repeat protein
MKFTHSKLLTKNKKYIIENISQAKIYVGQEELSENELKKLIEIDPTPTRKYVGWMAKQWVTKTVTDIDDLRNTIEEYNTFLNKGKAKTRDINQFKSFKDLKKEVNDLNDSGASVSVKDLESDYETIIDNKNLLIIVPHTHEASRKLGLSQFTFRDCGDGKKDSAWCTTFKSPEHFNDYYYNRGVTFYYIKIRPEAKEIINKLKEKFPQRWKSLIVTALAVLPKGQIDGYDGLDKQISKKDINTFTNIVGIS